ncbi:Putative acetyltransferase [Lacunisphaera limnophila]|uniref:Acetyltransferase n=1 Tax=Lacunisphaera limnophila TaxID=1838286 RepID=A0A1D8AXY4_9BACT|nr:acyltransferase [Lacunisphaera limnophila]AOS45745.1 Putative acetyltransferase [Lacunisphaera limnophila]
MNLTRLPAALGALARTLTEQVQQDWQRREIQSRYPGVAIEWPVQFVVDDFSALTIAPGSLIGPFSEIVVLRQSPLSPIPGRLTLGAGVRLGMGANLRAAGGTIEIGSGTQVGQHVSLIASNHLIDRADGRVHADRWDPAKTGVAIGRDCWLGAGAIILPGVTIADGAVIGAGSVVTKSVPARQIWHGNPARPA